MQKRIKLMHHWIRRASGFASIGILLVACNQGEPGSSVSSSKGSGVRIPFVTPAPVTISGQVFIVTKGRDNIKLALVEVTAVAEQDVARHLRDRHAVGIEQQRLLSPKLEVAEREARAAERAYKLASDASHADILDAGKFARSMRAIDIWAAKGVAYQKVKREIAFFDSPAFYLANLPSPVGAGKTDADGRFTLTVPPGKYVIAATSSRSVVKDVEHYHWLVLIDVSSPVGSLMLSNDNQVETRCRECVRLPEPQSSVKEQV